MILFQPRALCWVFPYLTLTGEPPISKVIIAHSNPEFHIFENSQQLLHWLMRWQEQSVCAHGTQNIAGEATACSEYLCYPFWRSAWKYKHKRLLCLVELKGQSKSKWMPHKSDTFPHVWASLYIYRLRDDASHRREGGVTQLRKGSMRSCTVLISGFIHLTSSYVIDQNNLGMDFSCSCEAALPCQSYSLLCVTLV